MYSDEYGEINTTRYMLPGKQPTTFSYKKYKKYDLSEIIILNFFGRRILEAAMNDDTEKHGLIVNIGNRVNKFINTVELQ